MLEPLGQSQVLSYLKHLAKERPVHLVSYEKRGDMIDKEAYEALASNIAAFGITWTPLRYHKSPTWLATTWDVLCGIVVGTYIVIRHRIKIVHARSYVVAVVALALKHLTGARFIFDMRGFWADERVDGGLWPADHRMYRIAKWFEKQFLLRADFVVSLTEAAVQVMGKFPYLLDRMPPTCVIPTCADLSRFTPRDRSQKPAQIVVGYVGSAGTWYLFDKVAACFALLIQLVPNVRFLILNRGEHEFIRGHLARAGIADAAVQLRECSHAEVPELMRQMDAGVFFIKRSFSKQASAPTKLAEFLGCGVPCLSNAGVGDMAQILRVHKAGVAIESFDEAAMRNGLAKLLALLADPQTRNRCVETARTHFSLSHGVRRYSEIYEMLEHSGLQGRKRPC